MREQIPNIDERYLMIFGQCRCGKVRRPVESDKKGYNKIECDNGHVKYIHKDY